MSNYKTRLCKQYLRGEMCPYGLTCKFAHGKEELKSDQIPPFKRSFKNKIRRNYRSKSPYRRSKSPYRRLKSPCRNRWISNDDDIEMFLKMNQKLISNIVLKQLREDDKFRNDLIEELGIQSLRESLNLWSKDYNDLKTELKDSSY